MEKINDRLVQLEIDVLSANDKKATQNREKFIADGVLALNLVSSPGSGKTTLLCNTINKIKDQYKLAVIEGDQQTLNDAERIRATGCRAIQINFVNQHQRARSKHVRIFDRFVFAFSDGKHNNLAVFS